MDNNSKYLSISKPMRTYIDMALVDSKLEEYEIWLLRRRAVEFNDDPDEVEMILKAEMAYMLAKTEETKTVVITQKPTKNIFSHFWNALRRYAVFKGESKSFGILVFSSGKLYDLDNPPCISC